MISINLISTPKIPATPELIERLRRKMDLLMLMLQSKIVGEQIPAFFPNGAPNIAGSVREIPATTDGMVIRGRVEVGGPRTVKTTLKSGAQVDYAAVQHEGISHGFEIRPFNKKALAFMLDGKKIITKLVHHPGLRPRPYMTTGLHEMQSEIVAQLRAEFMAAME